MESSPNWIVQLIGVILGGGVLSAAIQAIAQRKKVGSDTSSTFVSTADQQRKGLVEDLERARAERDREHERANGLDYKVRQWFVRADRFMLWARRQDMRNREAGIDDPMPELYPPANE